MMLKRLISILLACLLITLTFVGAISVNAAKNTSDSYIDNSSLLPKIVPDSQVTLDADGTPNWVETAIIGAVNLNTATEEGTLESSIKVLDHYAEMGVNVIWVLPVYDPGTDEYPNGYSNKGTHTINPKLTGTSDYKEGWKKLGWFVDEAHKRNIRIILDVITWGIWGDSPLVTEHPEYVTTLNAEGNYFYNWNNDNFVEYFISSMVDIAKITGCDGFRWDTEPDPTRANYDVALEVRERLWALGKKPLMISERENDRGGAYDLGQAGMTEGVSHDVYKSPYPIYFWLDKYNIVDSIKEGVHYGTQSSQDLYFGGTYHYYAFSVTCHDNKEPIVLGNRAAIGYQAIYTPFIPIIYLGEEFNNPNHYNKPMDHALYFNSIDWSLLDKKENRALFEDVKQMIRIRRSYPELFAYYPEQFKDSNICKVNVTNCEVAQPYARYNGDTAMLVIPNNNIYDKNPDMTVYMPFFNTGLDYYSHYKVTDAVSGEVIAEGTAADVAKFTVKVPNQNQRLFLVKASGKINIVDDEEQQNDDFEDNSNNQTITDEEPTDEVIEETIVIRKKIPKKESKIIIWPFVCGGIAILLVACAVVFVIVLKKKAKKVKNEGK